jgi:hypothetical protein
MHQTMLVAATRSPRPSPSTHRAAAIGHHLIAAAREDHRLQLILCKGHLLWYSLQQQVVQVMEGHHGLHQPGLGRFQVDGEHTLFW